jgi:hypothetical protein
VTMGSDEREHQACTKALPMKPAPPVTRIDTTIRLNSDAVQRALQRRLEDRPSLGADTPSAQQNPKILTVSVAIAVGVSRRGSPSGQQDSEVAAVNRSASVEVSRAWRTAGARAGPHQSVTTREIVVLRRPKIAVTAVARSGKGRWNQRHESQRCDNSGSDRVSHDWKVPQIPRDAN